MQKTYGSVTFIDGEWRIASEPHILMRAKRVFQKMEKSSLGVVALSATLENARDLEWFIQRYPMRIDSDTSRLLARQSAGHSEHIQALEDLLDKDYKPHPISLAIPPRDYQRRGAEIHLRQKFLLLGDDLGLGKTVSAICSMACEKTLPAVVVAYPHLQQQWAEEIARFAPDLFVHVVKVGTPYELPRWQCERCAPKKRRRKGGCEVEMFHPFVCDNARCGRGPDVVVITYTKLAGWADVLSTLARSVYFDEIQELRHTGTNKYLAAEQIATACEWTQGMSATPIFNYGGEIFNILNIICPGKLGTHEEFIREWCTWRNQKAAITNPKAFGSYLRENFLMLRRTRAEVGRELPAVIRTPYKVDCDTSELAKVEDSAAELARIILGQGEEFKGQKLRAAEELSSMIRQITGIAKAPYVADFVRLLLESGEKVVLCGWHRNVYEIWAARLSSYRIGWYTGSESPSAKEETKRAAIAGELDVVFLSLRSGAGLDGLQKVFKVIAFGELDWSPAIHEQCIGRLNRDGQTEAVSAYFLITDGGSDPIIADVLGIKRNQLEGIISPTADPIELIQTGPDKIKRLAEVYLKKSHNKVVA